MLFGELKKYLKITWSEEDADLQRIVDRGKAHLNSYADVAIDFDVDLIAQQLLLDYGRYVYNHSLELFDINFRRELLKLSIREGVKARALAEADSETST